MTMPAVFSVKIQTMGDVCGQMSKAEVLFNVDIKIAHPRFKQLTNIMNSKLARGEAEEYRSNAREYLELADELINNALLEIEDGLTKQLGWLGTLMGVLVFAAVILRTNWYAVIPLAGCIPVGAIAWRLKVRYDTVYSWGCELMADFEKRLDKQCEVAGFPVATKGDDRHEQMDSDGDGRQKPCLSPHRSSKKL